MRASMNRALLAATVLAAAALAAAASPAFAQETGDRATTFQAGAHQDIPGGTLLVAAYAIVLVVLLLYVVYIAFVQAGAAKEIRRLEAAIEGKRDRKKDAEPAADAKKD